MRSFSKNLVAVLAIALLWTSQGAHATLITYAFSGDVNVNHSKQDFTHFSGLFSFDDSVADANPGNSNSGSFPMLGALFGISVTLDTVGGPLSLATDPAHFSLSTHLGLPVAVGSPPDPDYESASGSLMVYGDLRHLSLRLVRPLSSDALYSPAGGFSLADFSSASFGYSGLPVFVGDPDSDAYGPLATLTCISGCGHTEDLPEPPSLALLSVAGAALLWTRRRRPIAR